MTPSLDLFQLRALRVIADAGSLTRAAEHLGVSQPALTVTLRQLEAHFGAALFDRDHRGVTPTAAGAVVLAAASRLFALLEHAEQEIRAHETELIGHFTLACHESLGAYFAPPFFASLFETAPRIELHLWNAPSAAVRDAVIERRAHFGLVVTLVEHPDLVVVPLFHDAVEVLVRRDRAATIRTAAQAWTLVRRGPVIYGEAFPQPRAILDALCAGGCEPEREFVCGDHEQVKALALAGLGVAIMPRRIAAYGNDSELVPVHASLPSVPDTISLIYRADMHRTTAAMALKDMLVAHGRHLDDAAPAARSRRAGGH